jgi:hypothetical protein
MLITISLSPNEPGTVSPSNAYRRWREENRNKPVIFYFASFNESHSGSHVDKSFCRSH